MASKKIALGIIASPVEIHDVVRNAIVAALPNRIATIWQEQHPQQSIPRAVDGIPATLTIDVDPGVISDIVEDLAGAVARKLEGFPVERE